MKLNFRGDLSDLLKGISIFANEFEFELSKQGFPVEVSKSKSNIEVSFINGKGVIIYNRKIHFFRALGLFIEALVKGSDFKITEEPQFMTNGIFFDCSRNAVLKVSSIKKFLRKMAVMGLDTMILYMEDTFEIKSRPYFGYMRGRYSFEELNECDKYAEAFGIEIVPYIQVLGHLKQALKWNCAHELKDTDDILLAGSKKTYDFIEEMIKAVMSPLRTRRIGIGIDEAYNIGLGRYLKIHGYRNKLDIMSKHLEEVLKITSKLKLKPLVPSDMYLSMASETGVFYDAEDVPNYIAEKVQKEMELIYWDYHHVDEKYYSKMFSLNKKLSDKIGYCGGIVLWLGMGVNYRMSFKASNAGLNVCKNEGIKDVFAAMFGDDGSESNYFNGLLGMQLYAEHSYAKELDMNKLKNRFRFCAGASMDDFLVLGKIDIPDMQSKEGFENPSKYMLYQDVLLGLFDKHIENIDTFKYYKNLGRKLDRISKTNKQWGFLFDLHMKLCSVLEIKGDLGIRIRRSYHNKDKGKLKEIAEMEIPELYERIITLKKAHSEQWLKTYKPFGWEVLDIRYGGILSRLMTAKLRLEDYIENRISEIEELNEEQLLFDDSVKSKESKLIASGLYERIVTGGVFTP